MLDVLVSLIVKSRDICARAGRLWVPQTQEMLFPLIRSRHHGQRWQLGVLLHSACQCSQRVFVGVTHEPLLISLFLSCVRTGQGVYRMSGMELHKAAEQALFRGRREPKLNHN
jgi:hypothetical protein